MGGVRKKLVVRKRPNYKKLVPRLLLVIAVGAVWWLFHASNQGDLLTYVGSHKLSTGVEMAKGSGQIYYVFDGKRVLVTHDEKNHLSPVASGKYIVWLDETNGQYQVTLYNLQTKAKLALSVIGNNTSPSIDQSHVAWQSIVNDQAVILYFNGIDVRQISGGQAAIRPYVKGDQVLFAQRKGGRGDIWQTVLYDDTTGRSKVVVSGTAAQAAWPRFEDDQIKTSLQNSAKYYN